MPEYPFQFDVDDDDDNDAVDDNATRSETDTRAVDDNPSFRELRAHARKLAKERRAMEKQLEQLRAELSQYRTRDTVTRLVEAGLSEKHASLFLRVHGDADVTDEAVAKFVEEYDIPVSRKEAATDEEPTPAAATTAETPQSFSPIQSTGVPSAHVITDAVEAARLAAEAPAELERLYQAGRVRLPKLPGNKG